MIPGTWVNDRRFPFFLNYFLTFGTALAT